MEEYGYWEARAEYADGTSIDQIFPYNANGIYSREEQEQYDLECWLIEQHQEHGDVLWYSVDYCPA